MSAASSRIPAPAEHLLIELYQRALPVRKRRELLTTVASVIRESQRWPWCIAAMFAPVGRMLAAQYVPEKGWPLFRELTLNPTDEPLGQRIAASCRDDFELPAPGRIEVRLIGNGRQPLGAIVGPQVIAESHPLLAGTKSLLLQLQEMESAQPNGDGVDWLRRRKLDALVEFAAGAGHEINNPVAAISGRIQLMLQREDDPAKREALATIGAQALRISQMIGDTMQFAEPPPIHLANCDAPTLIRNTLKKLGPRIREQQTDVKLRLPKELSLPADERQFATLLTELVLNGLNALSHGGKMQVSLTPPANSESRMATLEISDNGPGLTEQDRQHLFDPFYSGRQAGRGLGFGLCKCWRIAHQHGGTICVSSVPWVETVFTVQWPVASE